jgi:hypothetical protein
MAACFDSDSCELFQTASAANPLEGAALAEMSLAFAKTKPACAVDYGMPLVDSLIR